MRLRHGVRRLVVGVAALVALDLVLARTWLADGKLGKRPLPPFGELSGDAQAAALARLTIERPDRTTVTVFDRELGWCVQPDSESPSGECRIGPLGTRGPRDYAASPPRGVVRLVCFGDSFTFGDEVKDEWTFEALLEGLDPRIEALNFGVPAFGTDQALLRFDREGLHGAHVAVLGLLLENIGRNVNRYRPLWTPRTETPLAKPRFVLGGDALELVPQPFATPRELADAVRDGSILARLEEHEFWRGKPELWTGEWSAFGRVFGGVLAYRERSPEKLWLDREGEPRRVTFALVERFRAHALALGAKRTVVLLFPMKEELADFRASGVAYWRDAADEFVRRGIDVLDLAPALAAEEARLEASEEEATLYVAAHLSSVGNTVVARELHDWLAAQGLRR
ncbi:MAG: hypothetical protein L6Q99_10685 [Planctomycetes bacterium]|nr:hypothetical protein [Planctomycetota bacterium]